jgi:hypothetical protein
LTVTQRFEPRYDRINNETVICHIGDDRVTITAHMPDRLHRYHGHICSYYSDCAASAVVCSGNADPEIVRRAAATLRTIGPQEEVFYALLDSSTGCAICNRPLRDEVSKLIGVGPDCAKQNGIPHNMEAANPRLKLRRELLGEGMVQ